MNDVIRNLSFDLTDFNLEQPLDKDLAVLKDRLNDLCQSLIIVSEFYNLKEISLISAGEFDELRSIISEELNNIDQEVSSLQRIEIVLLESK